MRYWSHPDYTRIIIELDRNVKYRWNRLKGPQRVYFDFLGSRLDPALKRAAELGVKDPIVYRIRIGQNRQNVSRVVIDLRSRVPVSASWLSNPPRLAIELRRKPQELLAESNGPPAEPTPPPTFEEALRGESAPAVTALTPGSGATIADVEPSSLGAGALPPPWNGENQPPDTAGKTGGDSRVAARVAPPGSSSATSRDSSTRPIHHPSALPSSLSSGSRLSIPRTQPAPRRPGRSPAPCLRWT